MPNLDQIMQKESAFNNNQPNSKYIPQYVFDLQLSLEKSNNNLQICQDALKQQLEYNVELTDKVEQYEHENSVLKSNLTDKSSHSSNLKGQLKELTDKLALVESVLQNEQKSHENKLKNHQIELDYIHKDNKDLKEKLVEAERQRSEMNEKMSEMRIHMNSALKDRETMENSTENLKDKINSLNKQIYALESTNHQLSSKINAIDNEIRFVDKENKEQKDQMSDFKTANLNLEFQLSNERQLTLQLKSKLNTLTDQNHKFTQNSENLHKTVNEQQLKLDKAELNYEEASKLRDSYFEENQKLTVLVTEMKSRLQRFESHCQKLKSTITSGHKEIETLKQTNAQYEDKLAESKVINDQLEKTQQKYKSDYEEVSVKYDNLNKKICNISSVENDMKEKFFKVQSEYENFINNKTQDFKKRLENAESNTKQSQEELSKVKTEYKHLKERYLKIEHCREEYESSIDNMQKLLQDSNEELVQVKNDRDEKGILFERDLWRVCILEIVNKLLGRNLHAVDKQSLQVLELPADRVKLHNLLDHIYKSHSFNNLISHVVTTVLDSNVIDFSKQEYVLVCQRYRDEQRKRKQLHNLLQELKGNIRVCVRIRKLIPRETKGYSNTTHLTDWIQVNTDSQELVVFNRNNNIQSKFEYDWVFDCQSSQEEVFEEIKALVTSSLDGYNTCVMAYGQTGSGKTYSMEGTIKNPGCCYRAFEELFIEVRERSDWAFEIQMSVLEVYNEKLHDLLNKDKDSTKDKNESDCNLEIFYDKKHNVTIPNLTMVNIKSAEDARKVFEIGKNNRAIGSTNYNEHSSRSHLITQIQMKGRNTEDKTVVHSKLTLIDLAGSECLKKSGAEGDRQVESKNINKSLCSLVDVFSSLVNKNGHVPWRNSKLTYLLQDTLGGDSKVMVLSHVSPNIQDFGESVNTLHFSSKVNSVEKGQTKKNKKKEK